MQTAQMIGFVGGGVLISAINPYLGLALDAATFLLSAACIGFGVQPRPAATTESTRAPFVSSARAGARLIWRDRGLRMLVLFGWLSAFLIVYEGLAAPYTAALGGGAVAVGLILASDPFGSVIGALVFSRWVAPTTRPRVLGVIAVLSCVPLLPTFFKPGLIVSLVLFALAGALGTAVLMQASASFTRAVPDANRAQALGLNQSGVATIQGLSPLLAGLLADSIGPAPTVGIVGLIGLVIAIPAALTWRRIITAEPERWVARSDTR
jgi:MFS family permease